MFRSKLIVPALSVVCLLASQAVVPSVAAAASPLRAIIAVAPAAGAKMIHFNLANNSGGPIELKIGETPATLAVGETVKVTAAAGTMIVVAVASPNRKEGEVLAQVNKDLSGATIRLN